MAPRKNAANGTANPAPALEKLDVAGSSSSSGTGSANSMTSLGSLVSDPLPEVKVNKVNLGEIKGALDDIVKKHLETQAFKPSFLHPTVHLSLGYASIILSLGGVLYSFRMPFEEAKPVLWIAVVGYAVLQTALWAWKRWVEKGEVFRGRRKRVVKRIETDHLQILTTTTLDAPPAPSVTFSPHTRPTSPSQPVSPSSLSPRNSISNMHSRATSASSAASASSASTAPTSVSSTPTSSKSSPRSASAGPSYLLTLNLSTTSNNGKSLLHKSRTVSGRCVGEFIDEEGGVEEGEVTRWLSGLLVDAGLVGAEGEGVKAQ